MIKLKRAYEKAAPDDGYRILVDRLWPRGVSKGAAGIDAWMREVAPSNELRKWFAHDPAKFPEFARRYQSELAKNPAFAELERLAANRATITLVYAAKDTNHNQAVVLANMLK